MMAMIHLTNHLNETISIPVERIASITERHVLGSWGCRDITTASEVLIDGQGKVRVAQTRERVLDLISKAQHEEAT